jgi:hypothetical protein
MCVHIIYNLLNFVVSGEDGNLANVDTNIIKQFIYSFNEAISGSECTRSNGMIFIECFKILFSMER